MAKRINPNVYNVPNPINLDAAIASVQSDLAVIPWLQKIFGRARTVNRKDRRSQELMPMVYQIGKEYQEAFINDNITSHCFFRVFGPVRMPEFSNMRPIDHAEATIDLIVCGNLQKINRDLDYIYTETLVKDVIAAIRQNSNITILEYEDERPQDVFRGYTIHEEKRDLLMYPFFAFRITFILQYQMKCYAVSEGGQEGIFDYTFDETFE